MKWFNDNRPLAILLIALVIIAGAGSFFWLQEAARVEELRTNLADTEAKIEKLQKKAPFPNEANVETIEKQNETLVKVIAPTLDLMESSRIPGTTMDPIGFQNEVAKVQADLLRAAERYKVQVPGDFAFGFSTYLNQTPGKEHVPALLQQLQVTETLMMTLFAAGASNIISVKRLPVEELAPQEEEKGRRRITAQSPDWLPAVNLSREDLHYDVLPFVLEFSAEPDGIQRFLQGLVKVEKERGFYVTRHLEVYNSKTVAPTKTDLPAGDLAADSAERSIAPLIVFGDELVTAKIRIDYINWKPTQTTASK